MNITSVQKTIPLRAVWVSSSDGDKQVKAISYNIKFSLRTEMDESIAWEDAYLCQNISFQTITSFIYDQLHQTIIYDLESKADVERAFASHNNNFMILPDLSDITLATTLHSKFNAICNESSFVESVVVEDQVDGLEYNYFADDKDYPALPTIENWLGELSFWDTPWWERRDFSTFDNIAESKEDLDDFLSQEANQHILERMQSPINDLEDQIRSELDKKSDTDAKGEIVEVDFKNKVFKPRLVPKDNT